MKEEKKLACQLIVLKIYDNILRFQKESSWINVFHIFFQLSHFPLQRGLEGKTER
jgi:hypothetical protein